MSQTVALGEGRFTDAHELITLLKKLAGNEIVYVVNGRGDEIDFATLYEKTLSDGSKVLEIELR